jgi:hypothetical protein
VLAPIDGRTQIQVLKHPNMQPGQIFQAFGRTPIRPDPLVRFAAIQVVCTQGIHLREESGIIALRVGGLFQELAHAKEVFKK